MSRLGDDRPVSTKLRCLVDNVRLASEVELAQSAAQSPLPQELADRCGLVAMPLTMWQILQPQTAPSPPDQSRMSRFLPDTHVPRTDPPGARRTCESLGGRQNLDRLFMRVESFGEFRKLLSGHPGKRTEELEA
jgi:hypothetical protein